MRENLRSVYAGRGMEKASKNVSIGKKRPGKIIAEVSEITRIDRKDVSMIFRLIMKNIADSLVKGKSVSIRGLCTFYIQKKQARVAKTGFRRPIRAKHDDRFKPGTEIILPEKYVVKPKADKKLNDKVKKKSMPKGKKITSDTGWVQAEQIGMHVPFKLKKAVWNAGIERGELPPAIRVLASDPSIPLPNDVKKFV